MDDNSREFILKKTRDLVRLTEYKKLLRQCKEEGLLSSRMCNRIENLSGATEEEKHIELFKKITRRGPDAFDKLLEILIKLDFSDAVKLLHALKTENSTYISISNKENKKVEMPPKPSYGAACTPDGCYPSKRNDEDSELPLNPHTEDIMLGKSLIVKKSTAIQQNSKMSVYPMRTRNRGVLLMVNIIHFPKTKMKTREGADADGRNLLYLFKELGFTCFEYVNISSAQFFNIVDRLCDSEYTKFAESFVLILMSHGDMTDDMIDRVEFHDGSTAKLCDIEGKFTNHSCYNLRNKPKILMFPFCRGATTDIGISKLQKDGYNSNYTPSNIPTKSDMIVCYATVPGYQTMRDPETGSWYVQALCEVFAEHAHDTHLEDMLKIIGDKIKKLRSALGEMQTPAFYNQGFTKCLFFNPGVYED